LDTDKKKSLNEKRKKYKPSSFFLFIGILLLLAKQKRVEGKIKGSGAKRQLRD
jgi:hypothetical protein